MIAKSSPMLLLLCALFPNLAEAQTVYVSSQYPSPFVPLSGGTVALSPGLFSQDQATTVPIGFTFTYYGRAYDFIGIGQNGAVSLAGTCVNGCDADEFCSGSNFCERFSLGPNTFGIPSAHAPFKILAPWWDEINLDTSLPASSVTYALVGASPNREFVVEWKDVRHFSTMGLTGSRANFQLRLEEGTNTVRFSYGDYVSGMDDNQWSSVIGIEDPTGMTAVVPFQCANLRIGCNFSMLQALAGQVVEFDVPNLPQLTGTVVPPPGGQPGENLGFVIHATNVGRQPTGGSFQTTFYISPNTTINPATDQQLGTITMAPIGVNSTETSTLTVPIPNLPMGYYTVGALIDSGMVINQGTRTTNLVIAQQQFLLGSDLVAAWPNTPAPLPPSGTASITFGITNRSTAIPGVPWSVYLSTSAVLDANAHLVAQGASNVAARGTTSITTPAMISTATGTYSLILVVDPANTIPEIDKTNNKLASPTIDVGPDLLPLALNAPAMSGPGNSIALGVTIGDLGYRASNVAYEVWLSPSQIFDRTMSTLVTTGTTSVGSASQTASSINVVLPTNLQAGTLFWIVVVDPNNAIRDIDRTNNIATFNAIQIVGPDITAVSISGDPVGFRGLPYAVHAVVANQGGVRVANFFCEIHLATHPLITIAAPLLATVGPLTLAQGERVNIDITPTIPTDLMKGQYYLGIIADSTSVVMETNPTHQIAHQQQPIIVRDPAPDFTVTEVMIPATGSSGEVFTVQRVIENHGNASGAVDYAVYLDDMNGTQHITLIGQGHEMLEAQGFKNGVDTVLVPPEVPAGVYRVEYVVDPMNLVDELGNAPKVVKSRDTIMLFGAQISIQSGPPPLAIVGVAYRYDLLAQGGSGPLVWTIADGMLPQGLMLDPMAGRILGTPAQEGLSRFVVKVSDGTLSVHKAMSMLVASASVDLAISTKSLPPVWATQPYEYPLTAIGGVPPYRWSNSPALPIGLTLTSSGTIQGTTATTAASTVINFTVTDRLGKSATAPLVVRVLSRNNAVHFGLDALADGVVGMPYGNMLTAMGGTMPYTFMLADGQLPPGLMLDGDKIDGIPTAPGLFQFRLRVTDANGDFDLNDFIVTIQSNQGVRFVTKGLPPAVVGKDYADDQMRPVFVKAIASGSANALTYLAVGGMLPPGLMLNADGGIRGTPAKSGVYTFSIAASNDVGEHDIRAFGIAVADAPLAMPVVPASKKSCGCTSVRERSESGIAFGMLVLALLFVRRRRKSALAALVVLAMVEGQAEAQDAGVMNQVPYFTQSAMDTFMLRTGTTQLTPQPNNDDGDATVPLPFSFRFFDQDYTEAHVSTDGYMWFGSGSNDYSNHAIPSPTTPTNIIAVVWNDMVTPDLSYKVEGTAPSRVVVIQWHNSYHYLQQSETCDYQVWLYEGPAAKFEIHYGSAMGTTDRFRFTSGFENQTGMQGQEFLACSPNCTFSDYMGQANMVYRALQDGGVDLVAQRVAIATTADPIHVYQSIPFPVTASFASYHGQPIGPFTYSYNLVRAGQMTPDPQPVFTSGPVTLGAYETRSVGDMVTIPLATPPGRYRLALVVDPTNQIMDPTPADNVAVSDKDFIVGERLPDFTVGTVTAPRMASPGDTINVGAQLKNAGNLDSAAKWIIVLTMNPAPTASDLVIYSSPSPVAIPASMSMTATVPVSLPATLTPGRYYLGVIMDPENAVPEISKVNNSGRTVDPIQIGSPSVDIATTDLPTAYVGVDYSAYLHAEGGDGSYVWELTSGPLPAGLMFISGLGQIRGTPTAAAQTSITVRVDSNGQTSMRTFAFDVAALNGPLTIVTRNFLPGVVGQAYPPAAPDQPVMSQQHVLAVGGAGPATFTLTSTAPHGLMLEHDGYLHGIPVSRGVFDLDVQASDGMTQVTRTIPLVIVEPGRLTLLVGPLPDAILGEPYTEKLYVVGQSPTATVSFNLISGAGNLPDGLVLNQIGEIVGLPSKAGRWTFSVQVSEGMGPRAVKDAASYTLAVQANATLGISPSSLPDAVVGTPYMATLEGHNGTPPYNWSVDLPVPLPADLKYDIIQTQSDVQLRFSGTPKSLPSDADQGANTGGIITFLVKVDDAAGRHAEQPYALRIVNPPPTTPVPATKSSGCHCGEASSGGGPGEIALTIFAALLLVASRRRRT